MKKLLICALVALASVVASAQDVIGKWKLPDGSAIVEVYKKGDAFCARIAWLEEPQSKDTKNPDASLRNRPLLGLDLLSNLKPDGKRYSGGTIYDPQTGKTFTCTMELDSKNVNILHVKGYVGPFHKTMDWTRTK